MAWAAMRIRTASTPMIRREPSTGAGSASAARPVYAAPNAVPASAETHERFTGVLLSASAADVAPHSAGRLLELRVELGARVRAGDVIGRLAAPGSRAEVAVAEGELELARAEVARSRLEHAKATDQLARRRLLAKDGLASVEDLESTSYDERLAELRTQANNAAVAQKSAALERIQQEQAELTIRAPFNGVVAARYVEPGANVTPATPIVRLVDMGDVFVRFAVPQPSIGGLRVGRMLIVHFSDARPNLRAKVERSAPELDRAAQLLFVEAVLQDVPAELRVFAGELVQLSWSE